MKLLLKYSAYFWNWSMNPHPAVAFDVTFLDLSLICIWSWKQSSSCSIHLAHPFLDMLKHFYLAISVVHWWEPSTPLISRKKKKTVPALSHQQEPKEISAFWLELALNGMTSQTVMCEEGTASTLHCRKWLRWLRQLMSYLECQLILFLVFEDCWWGCP